MSLDNPLNSIIGRQCSVNKEIGDVGLEPRMEVDLRLFDAHNDIASDDALDNDWQ